MQFVDSGTVSKGAIRSNPLGWRGRTALSSVAMSVNSAPSAEHFQHVLVLAVDLGITKGLGGLDHDFRGVVVRLQ